MCILDLEFVKQVRNTLDKMMCSWGFLHPFLDSSCTDIERVIIRGLQQLLPITAEFSKSALKHIDDLMPWLLMLHRFSPRPRNARSIFTHSTATSCDFDGGVALKELQSLLLLYDSMVWWFTFTLHIVGC